MRAGKTTSSGLGADGQMPTKKSSKRIEVTSSSETECGQIIEHVLKRVDKGMQRKDVVIEYSGDKSLNELLPLWFEAPTPEDRAEIERIRRQRLSAGVGSTATQVVIPSDLSMLSSQSNSVPVINGEAKGKILHNSCQELIDTLSDLESIESDEWRKVGLKGDVDFAATAFHVGESGASTANMANGNDASPTDVFDVDFEDGLLNWYDGFIPDESITSGYVFDMVLQNLSGTSFDTSSTIESQEGAMTGAAKPNAEVDLGQFVDPESTTKEGTKKKKMEDRQMKKDPIVSPCGVVLKDLQIVLTRIDADKSNKIDVKAASGGVRDNQKEGEKANATVNHPLLKELKIVLTRVDEEKAGKKAAAHEIPGKNTKKPTKDAISHPALKDCEVILTQVQPNSIRNWNWKAYPGYDIYN